MQRTNQDSKQPVPSTAKHATGEKAAKHATHARRRKTCNRRGAQENVQPVKSTGKRTAGEERMKTYSR